MGDTAFGGYCIYHIDDADVEKVSYKCPSVGGRLMMARLNLFSWRNRQRCGLLQAFYSGWTSGEEEGQTKAEESSDNAQHNAHTGTAVVGIELGFFFVAFI